MTHLTNTVSYFRARFGSDEEGATMVEYGLLVALIAAALIITLGLLGGGIDGLFSGVSDEIGNVTPIGGDGTD